jgi:hypothetical protein
VRLSFVFLREESQLDHKFRYTIRRFAAPKEGSAAVFFVAQKVFGNPRESWFETAV